MLISSVCCLVPQTLTFCRRRTYWRTSLSWSGLRKWYLIALFEAGTISWRPNFSCPGNLAAAILHFFHPSCIFWFGSWWKGKKKGCVGVEMLFAVAHSRRISCRLQSTIPSELRAKAWTVAGFTEDALIFRLPRSTVLLEYWSGPFPKRWFIYELIRMVVILQSQRLSDRVDQKGLSAWVALMNMKDIPAQDPTEILEQSVKVYLFILFMSHDSCF